MAESNYITRAEASKLGISQFFTGIPCSNGHIAKRFTNDGKCVECNRIACNKRYERKVQQNPEALLKREEDKKVREFNKIRKEQARLNELEKQKAGKAKKDAIANGELHFIGTTCKVCGSNIRYTCSSQCVQCSSVYAASEEKKIYDAQYLKQNKEKIKIRQKKYYEREKVKVLATGKQWTLKNADKVKQIKRSHKLKKKQEKTYVLATRIASNVRHALKKLQCVKSRRTEDILGCSFDFFKKHFENQFQKGMSWDRLNEIHIDHIVPISSAKTEEDVIKLFHFTNLRPLWAKDNMSKGAKQIYLC